MKESEIKELMGKGLMRRVKSGEYELTQTGQQEFGELPVPSEKGTATKENLQKMLLDAGFSGTLQWENETADRERD